MSFARLSASIRWVRERSGAAPACGLGGEEAADGMRRDITHAAWLDKGRGIHWLLRDADWLNPTVLFLSLVAGVIASLVVDVLVVAKSRMPYVSDVELPKAPTDD